MKAIQAVVVALCSVAIIWIWLPTADQAESGQTGVVATSHDAGVNFLHLLGDEYEAASTMGAKEAFDHIEDRQVVLRRTVLFGPITKIQEQAAYTGDSVEFNQQQFTAAMKQIAAGLKSVR